MDKPALFRAERCIPASAISRHMPRPAVDRRRMAEPGRVAEAAPPEDLGRWRWWSSDFVTGLGTMKAIH